MTGKSESFITTDTASTLQLQEGLISKEMEILKQQIPTEDVKQSLPFRICTAGPPRWIQNIGRSLPASSHFPVSREEPELLRSTKDLRSSRKVSPEGLTVRLGCTTPSFPVRPRSTEERSELLIFLPTMPRARAMFPLFSSLQATAGLRVKADETAAGHAQRFSEVGFSNQKERACLSTKVCTCFQGRHTLFSPSGLFQRAAFR